MHFTRQLKEASSLERAALGTDPRPSELGPSMKRSFRNGSSVSSKGKPQKGGDLKENSAYLSNAEKSAESPKTTFGGVFSRIALGQQKTQEGEGGRLKKHGRLES